MNKLSALTTHTNRYNDYIEIAEGDLCWYEKGSTILLFFQHPSSFNRLPPLNSIEDGLKRKQIVPFESVLDDKFKDLTLLIELKSGIGNTYKALDKLISTLEEKAPNRYWIDTFSPELLKIVKEINQSTPTSLHTRLGVYGRYVIKTVWNPPFIGLLHINNMHQVDAVTVTYKYCPAKYLKSFGAKIDRIHNQVFKSQKKLIFGGIDNDVIFNEVKDSSAIAAYIKYSSLFEKPYQDSSS